MMAKEAYYKGKYFDSSEEMFEYAQKWNNAICTEASVEQIFKELSLNVVINIMIWNPNFTNNEMVALSEHLFWEAMRQMVHIGKNKNTREENDQMDSTNKEN